MSYSELDFRDPESIVKQPRPKGSFLGRVAIATSACVSGIVAINEVMPRIGDFEFYAYGPLIKVAVAAGVAIGSLYHFGRRIVDASPAALFDEQSLVMPESMKLTAEMIPAPHTAPAVLAPQVSPDRVMATPPLVTYAYSPPRPAMQA
jgi:hypothetical protein